MSMPTKSRRELLALSGTAAAASSLGIAAASFGQGTVEPVSVLLPEHSVKSFGAKGDGLQDDTVAIQKAIDRAIHSGGGPVYIPAGLYRITRTLLVKSTQRIEIVGDGASSILLHEKDEPLLVWKEGVECLESSVRNLCITSVGQPKSPTTPSIQCHGSIRRSLFADLLIHSGGVATGTGIELIGATNSIHIDRCYIWDVPAGGSGIKVGGGCEVRIFGGRMVAAPQPDGGLATGSIGLNLMGGNGGVHVVTTDFSLFDTALKAGSIDQANNRELFITHATFDAGRIGIHILNTAYVSISGCWCVSNDEAQILMEGKCQAIVPGGGALLSITGGSIANGGVFNRPGRGDGICVRTGSFTITGVTFWHNHGTALRVESNDIEDYAVSGCRFSDNDVAAQLAGNRFVFANNVITGGRQALIDESRGQNQIVGNVLPTE